MKVVGVISSHSIAANLPGKYATGEPDAVCRACPARSAGSADPCLPGVRQEIRLDQRVRRAAPVQAGLAIEGQQRIRNASDH